LTFPAAISNIIDVSHQARLDDPGALSAYMKPFFLRSRDVCSFYLGLVALAGIMLFPFLLLNSALFLAGCVVPFISLVASVAGLFLALTAKIKGVRTKRLFFGFLINGAALIFSIAACILMVWIFWQVSPVWNMDHGRFGDFIGK
jgi:hypothetical protein